MKKMVVRKLEVFIWLNHVGSTSIRVPLEYDS